MAGPQQSSYTTPKKCSLSDRLKALYPMVNESETPLPRSWSPKDKFNYIGLSNGNLRVHYKGHGKTHKDAASVRATHPIPASCGLYYFEVKIVSKGRDGYMGIGLSAQGVNMNRLPGWDKHSYGYHGDDGHSFCSSGTGIPYGPTFTTGDIIGCGVNLIDNTCFYTKNGHNLGIAFTDLPNNLYPTVGLQTPGEVVDANFGQIPFVFDIEDMMKELKARTKATIEKFPFPETFSEHQSILHRLVSSYLVHHGYCATAEAFASATGQEFKEEIASIKNRQRILKLVLAGRMGEAIDMTKHLYPGLLEERPNLHFMLKCRQFIEMVNGSDTEYQPRHVITHTSVIQSTKPFSEMNGVAKPREETMDVEDKNGHQNGIQNGFIQDDHGENSSGNVQYAGSKKLCGGSRPAVERMLEFGRELYSYSQHLFHEFGANESNKTMLQDAFSLLAYSNPWSSPVGWQLHPRERETVCAQLNSAILESSNMARNPPLEIAVSHAKELVHIMSKAGLGSSAFANVEDIILN
ncbi:ran-binding protein 9 [Cimex lectularius]|uniref:Ran-binding protein 9 n=1 Tax=Cimex lectularius TaxID=79782 RepID=A0A8I6RB19_CIMLE|nr:ran-binding protein 9 [Cimex lectularius]